MYPLGLDSLCLSRISHVLNIRATAFLTRSVRQDSRLLSHHGMRAGLALLILFLFFTQTRLTSLRGAVGAGFAQQVVSCCYWFLTILGGIHFSSTIAEEKDEQTLAARSEEHTSELQSLTNLVCRLLLEKKKKNQKKKTKK